MSVASAAAAAAQAIASAATIMALGGLTQRYGLPSTSSNKELSLLIGTVLEACLAFSSMCSLTAEDLLVGAPLMVWPAVHMCLALGLALALLPDSPRRGSLLLCATLGNAGAIPNPIVKTLFANTADSSRSILLVQLYLVTWRVLVWSVGPALLSSFGYQRGVADAKEGQFSLHTLRRRLLPPPTLASLAGICLAFGPAQLRALVLDGPLHFMLSAAKQVGSASPPLALMTLGFALSGAASSHGGDTFSSYETAVVCAIRLVLLPASHLLLTRSVSPLTSSSADPLHVVLLSSQQSRRLSA